MTGRETGVLSWSGASAVVAVCVVLHWVGLGLHGLSMSEGHRAVPGWEMVEGGWRWVPTMFEQAYARKPPGMAWAVAAVTSVFGETVCAARAVSAGATGAAALLVAFIAARWFGGRGAWLAGVVLAASPVLVEPARSAEIEALHNLGCLAAVLAVIEAGVGSGVRWWLAVAMGSVGVSVAVMTKGPAGVPAVVGAAAGVWMVGGWSGVARGLGVLAPGAAAAAGLMAVVVMKARGLDGDVVTQSPGEFLWAWSRVAGIAMLMPVGLMVGLPGTAAAVMGAVGVDRRARAAGLGVVLGLGVYAACGVSNVRYVMPALMAGFVLVPWAMGRVELGVDAWKRGRVGRRMSFVVAGACVAVGAGVAVNAEMLRGGDGNRGSGARVGAELGEVLGKVGAAGEVLVVHADDAIEARPEVLWEARRVARAAGVDVRVKWEPRGLGKEQPSGLWLRRVDAESAESGWAGMGAALWRGNVGKYGFELSGREVR